MLSPSKQMRMLVLKGWSLFVIERALNNLVWILASLLTLHSLRQRFVVFIMKWVPWRLYYPVLWLKTGITAMVAAADAARLTPPSPRLSVPELPHAPCPLHPGSARSAESAPDSAARQLELDERRTRRAKELEGKQKRSTRPKSRERERNSNAALRMASTNPVVPEHSEEDCVATAPDYSDWQLTARLRDELIPIVGNRQEKNLQFVAWSIRYMARMGEQLPYPNGTSHCGGYTKQGLSRHCLRPTMRLILALIALPTRCSITKGSLPCLCCGDLQTNS